MTAHIISAVMIVLIITTFFIPQAVDKIVFLDIGQGDSILFQNGTQQVLVDGGPGMTVLTRLAEELPWFDKTIEEVVNYTHKV